MYKFQFQFVSGCKGLGIESSCIGVCICRRPSKITRRNHVGLQESLQEVNFGGIREFNHALLLEP
jgi:hypothetical protein